jgi:hypothetical protein
MRRLGLPKGLYFAILFMLLAGFVVVGVTFRQPITMMIKGCAPWRMSAEDGAYPRWMLEATGYGVGGCAQALPSNAAPPNADWTMYCIGMCGCNPNGDTFRGACRLFGA